MDLELRSQKLVDDAQGHRQWESVIEPVSIPAERTTLLLCDVWNNHTCQGAVDRLEEMVPRINEVVHAARDKGVFIIHAPSETMEFYENSPARKRILGYPEVDTPELLERDDPPMPIDASDGGCDSRRTAVGDKWQRDRDNGTPTTFRPWTSQHPGVDIDEDKDGVANELGEVYPALRANEAELMLILGVHTNMCILNRSFGIKRMVGLEQPVALVRDLTDTMYDPAKPPYVSHDEGTRLVVEYIEKFWCPSVMSEQLL